MRRSSRSLVIAASLGVLASGGALAEGDGGDNSMSPYYGDSWADLQAHTRNMPAPHMQALQDRADAQAAFAQTRDRMRAEAQHWRDNVARMFRRASEGPAS